jgi:hypothetical protein
MADEGQGQGQGGTGESGVGEGGSGDGSGGVQNEFLQQLPEDLRGHASLANIKDMESLAKGYVNAQELAGRKGVLLPKEGASQAEWDYFYTQVGRPESPDKYHLVRENEQSPYPDTVIDWWRQTAFKHGLSQQAAKSLLEEYVQLDQKLLAEANETIKAAHEKKGKEVEALMRREWGAAYDQQLERGRLVADKFADTETIEKLREAIGAPALMRMFARIGEKMSEDSLRGRPAAGGEAMTPGQAKAEIAAITGDTNNPLNKAYFDKRDPGHQAAVARMSELYQYLHPEQSGAE